VSLLSLIAPSVFHSVETYLLVVSRLGTTAPRADTSLQSNVVGSDELLVNLLNRLEVVDSLDVKLQSGILVADNHTTGVKLDGRDSPHMVDTLLNALGQSQGLVGTSDDDADLAGIHDGAIFLLSGKNGNV